MSEQRITLTMSSERVQPRKLSLAAETGMRAVANVEGHVTLAVVLASKAVKREGMTRKEVS